MDNFEIGFSFKRHHYQAAVSVIISPGNVQYTVAPKDGTSPEGLAAQVFHKFPGKPLQAAFPGSSATAKAYTKAVVKALTKYLEEQEK
jgi:hypothetical protein